ncbi:MAG: exodeoxyribonuclease VII large subunit [Chitinophagaceae bacterium]|nr:exodeoxyribonuclease VII large subunit [Anaerolineae bacterium]
MFNLNTTRTVGEITTYIRTLLDQDLILQDVWITGEVSNMKRHSSGHWYFTLKDAQSELKCVMWRSSAARQSVVPKDGDAIEAHGKITVYESRGEYQLYADLVRPVGMGDLYLQFERLKARLNAEGLFDSERKRGFPIFPLRIGIVTSPTAAAFQDVLNVLRRRFPLVEVVLSPAIVQGSEAPPTIVAALERLNIYGELDAILLCRGGGSIEDLWPFNDERVARAVADSRIPVITGVGHETDFTIVDFVSDLRAPTPSAAAEMLTPDIAEMKESLRRLDERLTGMAYDAVINRQNRLEALQKTLGYISPQNAIRTGRQRIDELNARMTARQRASIALLRERLIGKTAALQAANPEAILSRGYAIVTNRDDGQRIASQQDATPGARILIQLKDGQVKARIEDNQNYEQRRLL